MPQGGLYAYMPIGSETAFTATISPSGSLTEVAGTRFDEIVTIGDNDTFEKYFGSLDQGPVVKGNVTDLTIADGSDAEGDPMSGALVYRGTSAVSDSSITYVYTRQAAIPTGYTSPCYCVDVYTITDHTDPNTLYPAHYLKDSGEITLTKLVTVTSS
jgi:hypothetical protein